MNDDPQMYEPRFSSIYTGEDPTDFTKWRFDVNEMLREIEHDLLGEIKVVDKDGIEKWTNPDDFTPITTREGARELISLCKKMISKISSLSILDLNEIKFLMKRTDVSLTDKFFDNWQKWELDKDRLTIKDDICSFIFIALKQALEAKTLDSLTKVEQIKRVFTEGRKEEGIRLAPFGKREG